MHARTRKQGIVLFSPSPFYLFLSFFFLSLSLSLFLYPLQVTIQGFKSYRDQTIVDPFSPHHNVVGAFESPKLHAYRLFFGNLPNVSIVFARSWLYISPLSLLPYIICFCSYCSQFICSSQILGQLDVMAPARATSSLVKKSVILFFPPSSLFPSCCRASIPFVPYFHLYIHPFTYIPMQH